MPPEVVPVYLSEKYRHEMTRDFYFADILRAASQGMTIEKRYSELIMPSKTKTKAKKQYKGDVVEDIISKL